MHDSLENMYKTNFALMQHHKYSLTELENMMPWEREIYVSLLINHINELEKARNSAKNQNRVSL
ncbi:base plate hub assembly catalyst [Cyanophage P-RSM6]|uniref:baseplate hub assembly catalyst n=1 Tax=Cyanophage P-RSM6 TaxID=929832 RepID=UPI0002C18473|nr:baseplate hub assembly catalyst [Cyanophage P-RSM6]AGH57009.1 base plate hub assembly catalyst [Cyanophage P-RSM6]